ncbi:MAG: flagellar hook-associated protein FlgK [Actinomycetales bacterium]
MGSTFGSLSTALTALYAQRRGLDVTGQNIANANTDGYSRQRVDLQAVGAPTTPSIWSKYDGSGGGVNVSALERIRDAFLEVRAQVEHGNLNSLQTQKSTLATVEQTLSEPGDQGLQAQLAEFWSAWHDVANNPGDIAARSQLLQRATTVASSFNRVYTGLDAQWTNQAQQLSTMVDDVNATAARVADLNQAIMRGNQAGTPTAELEDQRDSLIMHLSDMAGATTRAGHDGGIDVYIGGTALVAGSTSARLAVDPSNASPNARADSLTNAVANSASSLGSGGVHVVWEGRGYDAALSGGQAGATLMALNSTLPGIATQLNTLAQQLATAVNDQHAKGADLDGNRGTALFVDSTSSTSPPSTAVTAKTISVGFTDPRMVAAAAQVANPAVPPIPPFVPSLDNGNANALAALATSATGVDAVYRKFIVDFAVQSQTVSQRVDIQAATATNVDSAREAQAGVNLDEEMVNMMQFQHAYEGASRLMNAIDSTLDTLINRTGLVGR